MRSRVGLCACPRAATFKAFGTPRRKFCSLQQLFWERPGKYIQAICTSTLAAALPISPVPLRAFGPQTSATAAKCPAEQNHLHLLVGISQPRSPQGASESCRSSFQGELGSGEAVCVGVKPGVILARLGSNYQKEEKVRKREREGGWEGMSG